MEQEIKNLETMIGFLLAIIILLSICLIFAFIFIKSLYESSGNTVNITADGTEALKSLKELDIQSMLDRIVSVPMYTSTTYSSPKKKSKKKSSKKKV